MYAIIEHESGQFVAHYDRKCIGSWDLEGFEYHEVLLLNGDIGFSIDPEYVHKFRTWNSAARAMEHLKAWTNKHDPDENYDFEIMHLEREVTVRYVASPL